jgi:hypothetical protein
MRPANDVAPKFLCAKPELTKVSCGAVRTKRAPDLPAAAQDYAYGFRWRILPVAENRSKPPLIERWPELATSERHIVRGWWEWRPRANIALYTGWRYDPEDGWFILDVDRRHDGPASLAKLIADHGALPRTAASHTPGGGYHIYFRGTRPSIGPSCSRVGRGLDVKTGRSYIVLPPSVRKDGCYRWVKGRGPDDIGIAPTPGWLLDLAEPALPKLPPPGPRPEITDRLAEYAFDKDVAAVRNAPDGTGNVTLYASGRKLGVFCAAGKLSWTEVEEALVRAAVEAGHPEKDARVTTLSALRSRGCS